jgi:Raf kinase inhibitor-like YbhB/YbcL family protein
MFRRRSYLSAVRPLALLVAAAIVAGCGGGDRSDDLGGIPMTIRVSSSAFQEGGTIPTPYTGDGRDASPPLQWDNVPDGTRGLALIADDPDAPRGTWVHWVLYGLPADARSLEEGVPATETLPDGARQGKNDFGKIGYGGPAPPRGKPHRYFFKVYALDTPVNLKAGATKAELVAAIKGHVLAEGQLMGKYGRS